jgi:hypothetical protein
MHEQASRRSAPWCSRWAPARGRSFVIFARFDPAALTGWACLLFPKGRAGLEIIHQKACRLESGLPVRRGGDDEDDVVAWRKLSRAMDDEARLQGPARIGIRLDAR